MGRPGGMTTRMRMYDSLYVRIESWGCRLFGIGSQRQMGWMRVRLGRISGCRIMESESSERYVPALGRLVSAHWCSQSDASVRTMALDKQILVLSTAYNKPPAPGSHTIRKKQPSVRETSTWKTRSQQQGSMHQAVKKGSPPCKHAL